MDVQRRLRRLVPEQRTAVVLRYFHDYDYATITGVVERGAGRRRLDADTCAPTPAARALVPEGPGSMTVMTAPAEEARHGDLSSEFAPSSRLQHSSDICVSPSSRTGSGRARTPPVWSMAPGSSSRSTRQSPILGAAGADSRPRGRCRSWRRAVAGPTRPARPPCRPAPRLERPTATPSDASPSPGPRWRLPPRPPATQPPTCHSELVIPRRTASRPRA